MASAPISVSTISICLTMNSGATSAMPSTPSVFCAVSAVIAVMAKPPSAVTVLMSAWIPAPPPESDPAMINTRPCIPLSRFPSADRGGYLFNDLIDDLADEGVIYPLAHDADQRLGSRFPDQQPAFRAKALLTLRDHPLHLLRQQRIGAFEADVFQDLRERIEIVADLADRPSLLDNYREDLQRRDQPIARSAVIGEDNMPRLLAADIEAIFPHMFNHIAIADGGAGKGEAVAGEIFLKPHVGHDRRHNAAALQLLALLPGAGDQRHQLVAVDQ